MNQPPRPSYLTRHLVAASEMVHGGQLVAAGERFFVTDIDADYYLTKRKATEVQAAPAQPHAPKPVQQAYVVTGARRGNVRLQPQPAAAATAPVDKSVLASRILPMEHPVSDGGVMTTDNSGLVAASPTTPPASIDE